MSFSISRHAIVACAAVVLAACAGNQGAVPPPGTANSSETALGAHGSWMLPQAKNEDLLYVTNVYTVTVYSYPQGQLVGTLSNFYKPYGLCADKAGDVYVTDTTFAKIYEYKHGGTKPIATLKDPQHQPEGCAIDPVTGDLAVANYETAENYPGNVAVYRKARGFPRSYIAQTMYYYYFCGYDDKGNLYVDGLNNGGFGFEFAELHKGGDYLKNILLPGSISFPGGIEWDGQYVAVGDDQSTIDRFSFTSSGATLEGSTALDGAGNVAQFWIDGSTLIAPNQFASGSNVLFYNYPSGGTPTQTLTDGVFYPVNAVVSPAGGHR